MGAGEQVGSPPLAGDERDDLLALLAHELRTPLAPLGGFVDTVLEHYPDQVGPDADRLLRVAARNAARLQDIVDRVLRTVRAVSATDVVVRDVAVAAVIEEVVDEITGIEIVSITVEDDLSVAAGPDELRVLLVELVENAVVHGAPPVEITGRRDGDEVVIAVADGGQGVPADRVDQVFAGFTQSGSALHRREQGLGLGLRMARALAVRMAGSLEYETRDVGARFVLRLPVGGVVESDGWRRPARRALTGSSIEVRQAVTQAHDAMNEVAGIDDARDVLRDLVKRVGGEVVTALEADDDTLLVDLSLGGAVPTFARAGPDVRAVLERHLPNLAAMAATVLARDADTHYDATQVVDLLAASAVRPLRADLDRRFVRGQSVAGIVEDVLRPALEEVGHRWAHRSWTAADEHAATGLLEAVVGSLELRQRQLVAHGTRVTILGVPGDHHELPRRLLALQLLEHDVAVRWIGSSTPTAALARDLDQHRPDVLLLSCGFAPLLAGGMDLAAVGAERDIPVVVGGQGALRHPDVAAATGCVVAPGSIHEVVELLESDLPAFAETGLGEPWVSFAGRVRSALLADLPAAVTAALSTNELGWLVEATATSAWRPHLGAILLQETVDVLGRGLRDRGDEAAAALLAGVVEEHAGG